MNHASSLGFKRSLLCAAILSASMSSAALAGPLVSFNSGTTLTQTGIGDEINSGLDSLSLTGLGATNLNLASPVTVPVASYVFDVGVNCITCGLTPHYVADLSVNVLGYGNETMTIPYSWSSIGTTDFLHFGTVAPLTFTSSTGPTIDFVFKPVGTISGSGGNVSGTIDATITAVPEPSTYAMMFAGLGLLGLIARRKSKLLLLR